MNHNADDQQALKEIQHQWADARLKRDSSFATQIEADDFTVVWPMARSSQVTPVLAK